MLNLNQQLKRVEIKEFEIENSVVFNFFDKLPVVERGEKLLRAIYIGVLALMEDRISAFLAKTSNELGTELESLKMIFDIKKELFYKSSVKGSLAEEEIAEYLNDFLSKKNIKDKITLTGNTAGTLPRNKTGDIVCEISSGSNVKIAIECKFDKSIKFGEIEAKDIFAKKQDTAWNQLIEAQVNRDAKISIIVFDRSLIDVSILRHFEDVGYIAEIGFIAVVDSQKGDYSNLAIAYTLARDIAINTKVIDVDNHLLAIIVNRIIKDINEITAVKTLVYSNIENNKAILRQLEKSMLLLEFNQEYLKKFIQDGTLSKSDLLSFYNSEDIKDKYRIIEKEITSI